MNFQRNSLIYQTYSALIRDQKALNNKQLGSLIFWGLTLAILDLAGLALVLQLLALNFSEKQWLLPENGFFSLWFFVFLFFIKNALVLWIHSTLLNRMYGVAEHLARQRYLEYMHPSRMLIGQQSSPKALHELNGLIFGFADGILMPIVHFIAESLLFLGIACSLFYFYPVITGLLFLLLMPVTAAILIYNRQALKKNNKQIADIQHTLYKNTSELIQGNTELILHGVSQQYYHQFSNAVRQFMKLKKEYALRNNQLSFRTIEFSAIFGLALILQSMGKSSGVFFDLAIFGTVAFRLIPGINRIIGSYSTMHLHAYLLGFFSRKPNITPKLSAENKVLQFKKMLEIDALHFHFPGNEEALINDLSCRFSKGSITGITGPTGVGKSTLLQLLAGLYQADKGSIRIDGEILSKADMPSWYKLVAYVPQKLFISDLSILQNVAFSDLFGEPNIDRALRCLEEAALTDWVQSLPEGIYTKVGEGGLRLSGGQKQRLVLARALYKGADIFLFDEVSNALDQQTEEHIMHTLTQLRAKGKTLILVSHQMQVLQRCDVVYHFNEGKLWPFLSSPISRV